MRWRVLIGSRSFGTAYPEHLDELRAAGCELVPNKLGRSYREEELHEALRGMHAIVTGTDALTGSVIRNADDLRVIAKHGVGVENIDMAAALERGVIVASTPGAMTEAVAEMVFGLLLAVARQIPNADAATRSGGWPRLTGYELSGRTFGLIGYGRIAQAVAARAQAFGMPVVATDPFADPTVAAAANVELLALPSLLARADVVSLHAALNRGQPPILGRAELALMKADVILINTARGSLVDEEALADALTAHALRGAGLDVFTEEPPTMKRLLESERVVVTPHLAGQTDLALRRMGEATVANCLNALSGVGEVMEVGSK